MIVSGEQDRPQLYTHMHPFSPKLPSHPDFHTALTALHGLYSRALAIIHFKYSRVWGLPGGAVGESLPANAGDVGSIPDAGRSHMLLSN